MANRCPNCGGELAYSIDGQQLVCGHCGSGFRPEEVPELAGAEEYETALMHVFTCPNCGAQVASEELDAVDYCAYCGSFMPLNSRMERLHRPDFITPFKVTQAECRKKYQEEIKKKCFVPGELMGEQAQTEFRPVYIPYWEYRVSWPDGIDFKHTESWRDGDYVYHQEWRIKGTVDGEVQGCLFDASATLEDRIAENIADYSLEAMIPYEPSYMYGSYADIADVPAGPYKSEAGKRAALCLGKELQQRAAEQGMHSNSGDINPPEDQGKMESHALGAVARLVHDLEEWRARFLCRGQW